MTLVCSGHAIALTPYCCKALSDLLLKLKYSRIISFSNMVAHADILLSKCAQFRNESQFIDVRLKIGADIFPAHRIVLAASSDYFYAMFADGMKESSQEVIELKDESISSDVLKILLDSIYTGDLLVDEESVSKVLAAADHLQVASVVHQCCNFLLMEFVKIRFDFETYCRIWETALSYGLKDLQDASECAVAKMYTDVCESEEFLTHIGGNQLVSLLSRDDLIAPSETFVFKSVMQWINYKKEERMAIAAKVIGAVRLGLVDIGVVIDDLNTEEMQQIPEIYQQVHEAAIYKHRPTYKPKTSVEQTKPRSKNPVRTIYFENFDEISSSLWLSIRVYLSSLTSNIFVPVCFFRLFVYVYFSMPFGCVLYFSDTNFVVSFILKVAV